MKKTLLISTVAAAMTVASATAATKPALTKLNISSFCPTGLFQGNMQFIDVNNDGNLELLVKGRDVPNGWAPTIKILNGDGYGYTKGDAINDPDGNSYQRVVVPIDYNCDGNMDFILGASWGSKLMKGNGDGTFTMVESTTFSLDGEISIDENDGEKWYSGVMASVLRHSAAAHSPSATSTMTALPMWRLPDGSTPTVSVSTPTTAKACSLLLRQSTRSLMMPMPEQRQGSSCGLTLITMVGLIFL